MATRGLLKERLHAAVLALSLALSGFVGFNQLVLQDHLTAKPSVEQVHEIAKREAELYLKNAEGCPDCPGKENAESLTSLEIGSAIVSLDLEMEALQKLIDRQCTEEERGHVEALDLMDQLRDVRDRLSSNDLEMAGEGEAQGRELLAEASSLLIRIREALLSLCP